MLNHSLPKLSLHVHQRSSVRQLTQFPQWHYHTATTTRVQRCWPLILTLQYPTKKKTKHHSAGISLSRCLCLVETTNTPRFLHIAKHFPNANKSKRERHCADGIKSTEKNKHQAKTNPITFCQWLVDCWVRLANAQRQVAFAWTVMIRLWRQHYEAELRWVTELQQRSDIDLRNCANYLYTTKTRNDERCSFKEK